MAYNTKPIITDKDGSPVSQYFNPATDQYEPLKGAGGGNRVVVYKADGTESSVSLLPILNKLSQLTGTVIDEETRKSNELQRIALYEQIFQMLQNGELKGDKGDIGLTGAGLEFNWLGTQLGVRVQGELDYVYVDLKGEKGDKGDTGNIESLNAQHIEGALGYIPADNEIIGLLASLTTTEKANLVGAINELKAQSNENATSLITHESENTKKHIHSSGANSNGSYIKFDDGTLICFGSITLSDVGANSNGDGTWTFPSLFNIPPTVNITLGGISGHNSFTVNFLRSTSASTTVANVRLALGTSSANQNYTLLLIGTGRWKA